jgi:hypothetical protein
VLVVAASARFVVLRRRAREPFTAEELRETLEDAITDGVKQWRREGVSEEEIAERVATLRAAGDEFEDEPPRGG